MQSFTKVFLNILLLTLLTVFGMGVTGCAKFGLGTSNEEAAASAPAPETQPYYSNEFEDLLVPNELNWLREKSMVIRTDSFAGGILYFSGKVDINSLSEFFVSTMAKSGWKMTGSAQYKNILLAFVKPNKTCTITIMDSGFGLETNVIVYMTEDVAGKTNSTGPSMGLGQEL
jgi:hypothetical protein